MRTLTAVLVLACAFALAGCNSAGSSDGGASGVDGGIGQDGGGGDTTQCDAICEKLTAAGCANPAGTCASDCKKSIGSTPAACVDEVNALMDCASTAEVTCDGQGKTTFAGCEQKEKAFTACVISTAGDGGSDETDGALPGDPACTGKSQWDPCAAADYDGFCLDLAGLRFCARECGTPGEECPDGACYYAGLDTRAACLPAGNSAAGDHCASVNDCAAGMICSAYNDNTEICRPLCADAKPCEAGECVVMDSGVRFCVAP